MKPELKKLLDSITSQPDLAPNVTDSLMSKAFALAETPEEKREAGKYLTESISRRKRPDVSVKEHLGDMADALNLSYIAKHYFNKDRTWLYQRLNKSTVNGKPASFTNAELHTLSQSLEELSQQLHLISTQLTR